MSNRSPRINGRIAANNTQHIYTSMSKHHLFHYSVTVASDDLAVVGCLRSLSQHCNSEINPRIPWGGTKEADWRRDGRQVTFHFSSVSNRLEFLRQVDRLLPQSLWKIVRQRDDDPATPQAAD